MNWYEDVRPLDRIDPVYEFAKLYKNDENLKPDWVEHPAKNTEFHLVRNKEDLLLIVGESWTYGESLPSIATGDRKYSIESQIKNCFGPKLALSLNQDLYQYAVPGNCNFYMVSSLERILDYIKNNFNYKNINLCLQLTEPSREHAILNKLDKSYQKLYDMSDIDSFEEWLIRYDEIFLDEILRIKNKYNINVTVWKNFCCFQNKKQYPELKIIEESWIRFSGKLYGLDLEMQKFQSVGWFDDFYSQYKPQIKFDLNCCNQQIDYIEKSNAFIRGNYLHNNHPNLVSHSLWAYKLYNEYNK